MKGTTIDTTNRNKHNRNDGDNESVNNPKAERITGRGTGTGHGTPFDPTDKKKYDLPLSVDWASF